MTNPSRSRSHGREAFSGASLRVESARIEQKLDEAASRSAGGAGVRLDGGTVSAPFVRELYRAALRAGAFLDADWVERWDVAFAELYLEALDVHLAGGRPSRPARRRRARR